MDAKRLLGQRIQEVRKGKGWSQEILSEKAETSQNYLSRIESGKENPTLDMLIKLALALEVEMWEMFDFGHKATVKELKESLQAFAKTSDEPTLRLASKLLRAVSR